MILKKKIYKPLLLIMAMTLGAALLSNAQIPAPGALPQRPVLLQGATLHLGTGLSIESGDLIMDKGRIIYVGEAGGFQDPSNHKRDTIDCRGKHIYPGFIAPNTHIGLSEIDAVRATRDYSETGGINPHVRAQIAFNTDSRIIPTVRMNGVMIAQATPQGGIISGQSAVMRLDAWNWEDATILANDGMHLNWPRGMETRGWWAEPESAGHNKKQKEQITRLHRLFQEAQAYASQPAGTPDLKLEAMRPLFNGGMRLYLHAQKASDISEAILFARTYGIKQVVLADAEEAAEVIALLKQEQIPVILQRVHELPASEDVSISEPFTLAAKLHHAGITYCLSWTGDMEAMGNRNLPFGAGTTVTYGVPYEAAVQSITLNAARILGIDHHYGSLEIGKSATLFVSEGDALDMRGNALLHAYMDGRPIELNSHQLELYRKFSKKYGLEP